jgi:hypothetical protein
VKGGFGNEPFIILVWRSLEEKNDFFGILCDTTV